MRGGALVYRFGPFELDEARRRLTRGRDPIAMSDRHVEILLLLAANAGQIMSKDALIEGAWKDVAVADNSIEQAISSLRRTLGSQEDGTPYIETLSRRGYRFSAPVERRQARQTDAALDGLLAPYRAFVEGRAVLETLERDSIDRARRAFEDALRAAADYPAAHIGMANACVLAFESTRADAEPDLASLEQAKHHAREGCRLDSSSGEAWSTLAFVLHRGGNGSDAIAAARKAITLEPDDWRHHLRYAFVSWGEERLRAAHRVLALCPGLALAYWCAGTVFVARQAFDAALDELRAGCAAQDAQSTDTGRFNAVGLHLLHGLVLAAQGLLDDAREQLERELSFEDEGQLYARECAANTWYALGVIHGRQGHRDRAAAAFEQALSRVPGHALASIGRGVTPAAREAGDVDIAIVKAAVLALQGRHEEGARMCGAALKQAEAGPAGWLLPVEPLIDAAAHPAAWGQTLAILRTRAT